MYFGEVLPREFYERDPETVAKELLGKRLIRKLGKNLLEGIIVETEGDLAKAILLLQTKS